MKKFAVLDTIIIASLAILLVYSRFVGLGWGLPYPMHPDERNIAVAILQLSCPDITSTTCLHPKFFAYGQLSIYLGSVIAHLFAFSKDTSFTISFEHATLALRFISASASVATAFVIMQIVQTVAGAVRKPLLYLTAVVVIYVPGFIQFAHFGTTESLLMLYYALLLYIAIRFIRFEMSLPRFVSMSGMIMGVALGTKVSAVIFVAIPAVAMVYKVFEGMQIKPFIKLLFSGIQMIAIATIFFAITSPYNLIAWNDFMGSMNYESSVGLGTYRAFYTRQFEYTIPFIFQFIKVFPFTLGGPLFFIAIMGFIFLPFTRVYNFLRLQIVLFFIPSAIIYAKWARFLTPIFPAFVLMGALYLIYLLNRASDRTTQLALTVLAGLIVVVVALPGLAYMTIYKAPDVRFIASQWVYKNIPSSSTILSETANVVDIPVPSDLVNASEYEGMSYDYISFNYYELDNEPNLPFQLDTHLSSAEYIFVPSRRVFYNHTCYRFVDGKVVRVTGLSGYETGICEEYDSRYPLLNTYYKDLFMRKNEFVQVAEFSSFPRIELFGKTFLEFPDEDAEETWTVFDHPVIRIYKRT